MKKLFYTVKGLNCAESGEVVVSTLRKILPEAEEVSFSAEESRIYFSLDTGKNGIREAELKLSGALSALGFELILPACTENYAYVGAKQRKVRKMPVAVAVSLIAAFMALTMLFTFAACDLYSVGGNPSGGSNSTVGNNNAGNNQGTTNITIDGANLPDYIEELVKLDEIFRANSYEGINEDEITAGMLKAYIAATGDKFAEYMTAEEYKSYTDESNGDFVGVGVSIVNTTIEVNGYHYKVLQIISVFKDSPALESGLRVGDCIMYVGEGSERTMVNLLGYTEALNQLLGEAGTEAKFTVFRPDNSEDMGYREIEFSIERRKITTESVTCRVSETDSKVGIINITGFDMTTAPQLKLAVNELKGAGCESFVFDLRNNGGGALYSIIAVLSYFLDNGDLVVSTEYNDGKKDSYYVRPVNYGTEYEGYNVGRDEVGMYKDMKSVVLVNENTASAAELFTATFRDYGIAKIVGTTTYGKGCMQNIISLERYGMEGALRVTTAMYFSKSHTVYHEIGIVPDHEIVLSEEAAEYNFFLLPEEKDNQLQKAIAVLTGK